jgi:tripartite-type tricarboxylate transporter receptor subunit TctC
MRRRNFLAGLPAALAAATARADTWPQRPIHIVVPFPPGGAADAVPRGIAQHIQQQLGATCLIDNRPGASGTIGANAVAKAEPDGYTLLSHVSAIVIQPHLGPAPYDVLADLVPITQTVAGSYVLVAHPSFPADDLPGFIESVRGAPGRYNYGSFGSGSGPHLAMELLKAETGLFIVHVPFRGAAPALQELLAGRLDLAFDTTFAALPHLRAGRLKAIALGGAQRLDSLPGVPTVAETLPGFDTDGWQGLFAPAGTPPAVLASVESAVAAALRDPQLAQGITRLGFRPVGSPQAEFASRVRADHEKWARVVRERNIRPD